MGFLKELRAVQRKEATEAPLQERRTLSNEQGRGIAQHRAHLEEEIILLKQDKQWLIERHKEELKAKEKYRERIKEIEKGNQNAIINLKNIHENEISEQQKKYDFQNAINEELQKKNSSFFDQINQLKNQKQDALKQYESLVTLNNYLSTVIEESLKKFCFVEQIVKSEKTKLEEALHQSKQKNSLNNKAQKESNFKNFQCQKDQLINKTQQEPGLKSPKGKRDDFNNHSTLTPQRNQQGSQNSPFKQLKK